LLPDCGERFVGGIKLSKRLVTRGSWRAAACALVAAVGIIASAGASAAANGWSTTLSPGPLKQDTELAGISCASATSCMGVGFYSDGAGVEHTFAFRGSGSSWARVASPSPSPGGALVGVSCAGPNYCVAVGSHVSSTLSTVALVEKWDGSHWTIVPSPNPAGVGGPYTEAALDGVWCASATSCIAVGFYDNGAGRQTLTERWDGTTWTIVSSPNPTGANELSALSCLSTTNCFAVGYTQTSVYTTLVEHWNGTTWTITPSANPAPANLNTLSGVSCPSVQNCFAVGTYSVFDGGSHTLIEHWNGTTWAVIPSHTPAGALQSELRSVSCISPTSCVAVGSFVTNSNAPLQQPLVQQGNASSWNVVPSAKPSSATASFLSGSSCAGPTTCVAVGSFIRDGIFHSLIERD
jgi:hypothetical protein